VNTALDWKGNLRFDVELPSGATLSYDNVEDYEVPAGPSPMEGLLSSLAACMAMDVISILQKKRQNVVSYRVEIEADRKPRGEWPRPFEAIRVKHIVGGEVEAAALERAIELSEEKYCSVSATLRLGPQITNSVEIR
jgi:putative redox protein